MLHEKMLELLKKKKQEKGSMDPMEAKAKMGVLSDVHSMVKDAMHDKLHGLKKVTVASNSPDGLEKGLDKAKSLVEGHDSPEMSDSEVDPAEALEDGMNDDKDSSEVEHAEGEIGGEDLSPEAIDEQIQHLLALKAKLGKK